MNVLYVDACVREDASRTRTLATTFLQALQSQCPTLTLTTHHLSTMCLTPLDAASLAAREALCDARAWSHPSLQPAVAFQQADAVVMAAPYWDLSFPAMVKVWVERMYVRNLTFVYRNDQPVGLCRGKAAIYLTTAGSPVGMHNLGADYLRAVFQMLGIPDWTEVRAEGLDIAGADVEALLNTARQEAVQTATRLAHLLSARNEQNLSKSESYTACH